MRSRTIKTLVALIFSMTIGASALMLLETAPARGPAEHLSAVAAPDSSASRAVNDTAVPVQSAKWRNIVVHSSAEGADIAARCHFIIEADGTVRPTSLWRGQVSGRHVFVAGRDFNADSIGVCIAGDFTTRAPSRRQMTNLTDLTQSLQRTFRMPANRVYLMKDLDGASRSPGAAFPTTGFNSQLLRSAR